MAADLDSVISTAVSEAYPGAGVEAPTNEADSPTASDDGAGDVVAGAGSDAGDGSTAASDGSAPSSDGSAAAQDGSQPSEGQPDQPKAKNKGRLPYERHEEILNNARQKHATELSQRDTRIRELQDRYESPVFQNRVRAMDMADQHPEQFLSLLAQSDPRYARLLGGQPSGRGQADSSATVSEKPQPDLMLGDGTRIYSAEQQERLADWKAQQRVAELEQRYAERFGPIEQEYRTTAQIRGAVGRVRAQLADADTWPGFSDAKTEIAAAMQADRALTLEAAYRKVVLPKFRADRDRVRQEVLAEINQRKPRAASGVAPGSAPAAATPSGPRDLEDVIRESIGGLTA